MFHNKQTSKRFTVGGSRILSWRHTDVTFLCRLFTIIRCLKCYEINFLVFRCTIFRKIGRYDICLKVHKNENFFGFDFEFCTISLLVMSKY